MGRLTSEKQKELMKGYYSKYYATYFPKYGHMIDLYIKKFFPKSHQRSHIKSFSKSKSKSISKNYHKYSKEIDESMKELAEHSIDLLMKKDKEDNFKLLKINKSVSKSRDFMNFLYDLIYRRILIHELRDYIYRHIPNENEFMKCLKNPEDYKKLKYISAGEYGSVYRLNEDVCIKFVNVTNTLNNLKYVNFLKEMEISKIAGNIGVGPKIYDSYICVNDLDSTCYGIIYMEYLHGITLSKYLDSSSRTNEDKIEVRKLLDEKIMKLHQYQILHSDLHSDNVFIILDNHNNQKIKDVKIIDYGFSQYIQDYIYFRNHYRLNDELFHFSRHYIYHELSNLIYQKVIQI
jgi:hypothetical protein